MSLFQCGRCGCVDNTVYGVSGEEYRSRFYDWTGIEDRLGKDLCCACAPTRYAKSKEQAKTMGGKPYGQWHNQYDRNFLPMDMFYTNRVGNLAHKETHSEDYAPYIIRTEKAVTDQ